MGYDASVYVMYCVKLTNYYEFIMKFLSDNPDIVKDGNDQGYDMSSAEEALEFVENNYENDMNGNFLISTNEGMYICPMYHKHCVCRSKEPAKELVLPTEDERGNFDIWCQKYGLGAPRLSTVIQDSH